jgi:hypothetical protein
MPKSTSAGLSRGLARHSFPQARDLFAGVPPDDFSQDHALPWSQILMALGFPRGTSGSLSEADVARPLVLSRTKCGESPC